MPVSNIVDRRTNSYNVNCMVVFEESWHDNSIDGSTQFNDEKEEIMCLYIKSTTVGKAIKYANLNYKLDITMFIYDLDEKECCDYDTIDDNLMLKKL
jgi:hypothetical protein